MLKKSTFLKIIFTILSIFTLLLAGIFYALIFDVAQGQGLAGGAIVMGYGIMGAGIGLVLSVFIIIKVEINVLKILIKVFVFFFTVLSSYFIWNYHTNIKPKREKSKSEIPLKPTEYSKPIDE